MFRAVFLLTAMLFGGVAFGQDEQPVGNSAPVEDVSTEAIGTPATVAPVPEDVTPSASSAAQDTPDTKDESAELELGFEAKVDQMFGTYLVSPIASIFFWTIPVIKMPLVVFWLLGWSVVGWVT